MDGTYSDELLYDSDAGPLAAACKNVALKDVYSSPKILKREVMGRKIIHDLMDLYWEAAKRADGTNSPKGFAGKMYGQISPNYRYVFGRNMSAENKLGLPKDYYRMQLLTDQISGMTDTYAVTLHKELTNG
jgi:dGTPase